MNRLEKKCMITAAALHGLLVVILFVGPALVPDRKNKDAHPPVLSFINPSD